MNNKKIMLLFSIQGTSTGIIGTIFGTLFGYLVLKKINYLIFYFNCFKYEITLPVYVELKQIIIIAVITILISFLSTLYPAKLAANINPTEILRHE